VRDANQRTTVVGEKAPVGHEHNAYYRF
jgi:hypothetical protein